MCHNSAAEDVLSRVKKAGMKVETMIENVGSLIREGAEEHRRMKRQTDNINWDNYQRWARSCEGSLIRNCFRYDTIIPWMEQLAADNPSFVTLTDMGRWGEIER